MGALPRPAPGAVGLPGRGSPRSTTPGPRFAVHHLLVTRRGIPACRCRVRRGTFAAWRPPARPTWIRKRLCIRSWLRVPLRHLTRVMSLRPAIPWLGTSSTAPRRHPGGVIVRITVGGTGGAGCQCGAVTMAAVLTSAPLGRRVRTSVGMTGLLGTWPQRPCLLPRYPPRPRQRRRSFYFVDAEIEEATARPHLATVTLEPEQPIPDGLVISCDLIRDDLAAYISDFRGSELAWEVTETAPLVFSVPFPLAELLRVCLHGPICCPLNQFLISVQAATSELDPVPPLEKVWVLVHGLPRGGSADPRGGKLTHILKAISEPMGKLITADLASFEDDVPARIEILCPAPAEIDGLSLVFYFGS
ncbi:hypothetical protein ZWY2020_054178 [Hordeum vulgare]|nr:hypothetical protein ZWY2020_054178 [Hordeum vulgare]